MIKVFQRKGLLPSQMFQHVLRTRGVNQQMFKQLQQTSWRATSKAFTHTWTS